jgi:hypothetical protein
MLSPTGTVRIWGTFCRRESLTEIRDLRKIIVQYQLVTGYEIGFLALQIELS